MLLSSRLLMGMSVLAIGSRAQFTGPFIFASTTTSTSTASQSATDFNIATTTTSTASSSTSSSAATTHTVAVGAEGFKFSPNVIINASVGDVVEFRFYPTGHWVVRAEYKYPCIPYEDTGPNKVGFTSGQVDVATTTNDGPTFRVLINDTDPIFFYCAASGSCIGQNMIGVINPNDAETYDVQLAYTKNSTIQMVPGEAFPSETAASTAASATSTSSGSSSNSSSGSHSSLGGGAIAGIAIGGALVILMTATLTYLCGRRGGLGQANNGQSRDDGLQPPMVEAKYGPEPKSPGQETYATTAYSTTPTNDTGGYSINSGSPPPMSVQSQNSYQHFGGQPRMGSPLIQGVYGNNAMHTGFFTIPPPHQYQQHRLHASPVELPTSADPGNSPLPKYSATREFSWSQGGEGNYRPWKA